MTNKNSVFIRLFSNNKLAFLFSALLAVVIWMLIAMFFSPVEERTIDNIPVVIDLEDSIPSKLGLEVFGQNEFKVSVTVSGKRYVISPTALTADDIVVTANTNYVDTAGKNNLTLEVAARNSTADFEITGCSEESIEVFFDHRLEKEYEVKTDISPAGAAVADGFIQGDTVLSSELITVSGPATEVEKISKVIANVKVEEPLTKTTTYTSTVIPVNEYGGTLRYLTINGGTDSVTVTVPVLKAATLEATVLFKSTPSYFADNPISYVCSPETLNVAMASELITDTRTVSVGSIDFSLVNTGYNSFTFAAEDIPNATITDDTKEVNISFTLSAFEKRVFTVPKENVKFENSPDDITAIAADGCTVTVIGLPDELETLTAADITLSVDLAAVNPDEKEQTLKAAATFNGKKSCWVFGSCEVPTVIG